MANLELESLESRLLLSAGTLYAGQAALFDVDGNGSKDAILVNEGVTPIEYGYSGGTGLDYVRITADGGKFSTNTWVASVGDNSDLQDFYLASAKLGTDIKYGRGQYFSAIAGTSAIVEGSLGQVRVSRGDLATVTATQLGGIDQVTICRGSLVDLSSAGNVNVVAIGGNILGNVDVAGDVGQLAADKITGGRITVGGGIANLTADAIAGGEQIQSLSIGTASVGTIGGGSSIATTLNFNTLWAGTIQNTSISVGGNMAYLNADLISGDSQGYTAVAVSGSLDKIWASTITGGANGSLDIYVGAGVQSLVAGSVDGGQATDGWSSWASIAVSGGITSLQAGQLSGGSATGAGSSSSLNLSVYDLWGDDGITAPGDVNKLNVGSINGGQAADGAYASLSFSIDHDLVNGRVGQIVGAGLTTNASCQSWLSRTHYSGCWQDAGHRHYGQGDYGGQGGSCGQSDQSGQGQAGHDPFVFLSVGHDIINLVTGSITGGAATGDGVLAFVFIWAGHDIQRLVSGTIDAGSAQGAGAIAQVSISASHDIGLISANSFTGGVASGDGASAGLYISAGRNIDTIAAGLISGTQATRPISDPTVQFRAYGDIGVVMAGQITGGTVTADGQSPAEASVLLEADGTYYDSQDGQSIGDIGAIYVGAIRGGTANGAEALAHVNIKAANDISKLYADTISGGRSANGGVSYVDILAERDIVDMNVGTILGSENSGGNGCDPTVQIRAFNDIKSLVADKIIAGQDGVVNILAGMDAQGNVSDAVDADGNLLAGSIEKLIVGVISGNGGIVNIAAGGNIDSLKACQIVSGNGEVNIVAGGEITASVGQVRSWAIQGETGVTFSAVTAVNDVRNTISSDYTFEGGPVEFPDPMAA